jgi:hypothetical protein
MLHLLQDDPVPPLAREVVAHTPGKKIDTYLKTSPFLKPYVAKKFKGGVFSKGISAEKAVHIHKAAEFRKKFIAYALPKTNPDTGKKFTKEEAEAFEPSVNAFQDDADKSIHIHEERGEAGTGIHEAMHLFCSAEWKGLGFNANEGATEFFTKVICKEQKIERGDFYPSQYDAVKKLAAKVTDEDLASAYYKGKLKDLKKKIDKATKAGNWDKWVSAMQGGKYDVANALVA